MADSEEKETSKLHSRKFIVWLVWLTISVLVLGFCTVVMIITQNIMDSMMSLIEKTLGWFFSISLCYISVNGLQKVGFAVTDAFVEKKEGEANE